MQSIGLHPENLIMHSPSCLKQDPIVKSQNWPFFSIFTTRERGVLSIVLVV